MRRETSRRIERLSDTHTHTHTRVRALFLQSFPVNISPNRIQSLAMKPLHMPARLRTALICHGLNVNLVLRLLMATWSTGDLVGPVHLRNPRAMRVNKRSRPNKSTLPGRTDVPWSTK